MPTTISGLERRVNNQCEVRLDESDGSLRMVGYAAIFNSFSLDLGGFREIIRRGAFARSLANNPDVRLMINHDGLPLARTKSKNLMLFEDQRGLRVEAKLDPEDSDVKRLRTKMARGDLDQMSFAFRTLADSWRTEDGNDIRELLEVEINDGDVSIVTYPAYPATEVGLRSLEAWKTQVQQQSQEQLEAAHRMRANRLKLLEMQ